MSMCVCVCAWVRRALKVKTIHTRRNTNTTTFLSVLFFADINNNNKKKMDLLVQAWSTPATLTTCFPTLIFFFSLVRNVNPN